MRRLWTALSVAAIAAMPVAAQLTPVIDNDEVRVFDLRLAPGEPTPDVAGEADAVVLFPEGGRVSTPGSNGRPRPATRRAGDAIFVRKGAHLALSAFDGEGVREIVVVLKDGIPAPIANPTHLPLAFPRPGIVKKLDNDRVTVWHYRWKPGVATPVHFHDKDVVIAYLESGSLKSTATDGQVTVNSYKAGEVRFNKGNRAHSELLEAGQLSAMMVELKR